MIPCVPRCDSGAFLWMAVAHWHMTVDDHDEHGTDEGPERVTSPMQAYSTRAVGIGFVILAIGLLVTFAIPLLVG